MLIMIINVNTNTIILILNTNTMLNTSTVLNTNTVLLIILNTSTVSFHHFKSQKIKLSVSNPKSKHVAYLSVLSQISNC